MLTLGLSKLRHVVWGSLIWCTLLCPAACISSRVHRKSGSHSGAGERLWCWVVTGFAPSPNVHTVPPATASCHHTGRRSSQEHQSWVTQCQGILTSWSKAAAGSLLVSFALKPSHAVSAGWWQMWYISHVSLGRSLMLRELLSWEKKAIFHWKTGQGASSESKHIE